MSQRDMSSDAILQHLGHLGSRWMQDELRRTVPALWMARISEVCCLGRVLNVTWIEGGLRNGNFRIDLESGEPIVLRIYEQDRSICRKEVDLIRHIGARVPVPEVLHAEPDGFDEIPPFTLMRFVEGVTFRDLKRRDPSAVPKSAHAIGETLAAIGRITFEETGWIGPGLNVGAPLLQRS